MKNVTFVTRNKTSLDTRLFPSCSYHFIPLLSFKSKLLNSLHSRLPLLSSTVLQLFAIWPEFPPPTETILIKVTYEVLLLVYWTFPVLIWPIVGADLILYYGLFCSYLYSFIPWVPWPYSFVGFLATRVWTKKAGISGFESWFCHWLSG